MRRVIGIDFDNTIVTYDRVFYEAALERGLIAADIEPTKLAIRDCIRQSADGDVAWQRMQGLVYGPLMARAQLMSGLGDFLTRSRRAGHRIVVVSHKTEQGHFDDTGTNLRTAALDWMDAAGLFDRAGFGLDRGDVYFEGTRPEKVRRIAALECSDFIDDLEEVFLEPEFPAATAKVLFAPHANERERAGALVMRSWQDISEHYFGHA
jgi:hypothetical protein